MKIDIYINFNEKYLSRKRKKYMNLEKIKNAKTQYLGKNIIYFPELTSTQDIAKQAKYKNGTIIITDYQTNGKGTKDRKWLVTKQKNITMTLILYPNIELDKLNGITVNIATAIKQAIFKLYEYELTIKKPNDLLLNGKKIAGILTESKTIKNEVTNLYIGIGFNVNEENFDTKISSIATSLKKEYGKEFEREEIIGTILEQIEKMLASMEIVN